jgi:hypothetical protein
MFFNDPPGNAAAFTLNGSRQNSRYQRGEGLSMGCGPEFPDFLGDMVVHEQNSESWEFGKGGLCSVAVLQSKEKRSRLRLRLRGE